MFLEVFQKNWRDCEKGLSQNKIIESFRVDFCRNLIRK